MRIRVVFSWVLSVLVTFGAGLAAPTAVLAGTACTITGTAGDETLPAPAAPT